MQINIYYGGRGLIEDSTLYVVDRITQVLEELRVSVRCYKLYENRNEIAALTNTLKEANGVILAANVEWFGFGGLLQEFLDNCWLYADKTKINSMYMMPVVISRTYGEKEAETGLNRAWELLGGKLCPGISAFVSSPTEFETNKVYTDLIEKKAEDLYRMINQKQATFPTSNTIWKQHNQSHGGAIELTPQESEQLSVYVSDDSYVKKQKADIEELSELFKEKMIGEGKDSGQEFIKNFKENFQAVSDSFNAVYVFNLTDVSKSLIIEVKGAKMKAYYGTSENGDVISTTTKSVINKIVTGRGTFQGSFMTGDITAKGDFGIFRKLDQLFPFNVI